MRHFFHRTNKSFYLQSLVFHVVSMEVVRQHSTNRHARGK